MRENQTNHRDYSTIIRLHSAGAYPTHRSSIFTPSYSAAKQCFSAAQSIANLSVAALRADLLPKLGPLFAYTMWIAACVFLVHGSTINHDVDPLVDQLIKVLREMGKHRSVATRYADVLARVLKQYRDHLPENTVIPAPLRRILVEMRRTAFDLHVAKSRRCRGAEGSRTLAPAGVTAAPDRKFGPTEFEYLDVFDFFNRPRLELGAAAETRGSVGSAMEVDSGVDTECNITNYMVDASSDWLVSGTE